MTDSTAVDGAKWQFKDDSERLAAIEAEADAQARIAEANGTRIDMEPIAWSVFGCCIMVCLTVLKINGAI